jgi:hypothetical protein
MYKLEPLELTIQKLRSFRSVNLKLQKTNVSIAEVDEVLEVSYPGVQSQLEEGLKKLLEVKSVRFRRNIIPACDLQFER